MTTTQKTYAIPSPFIISNSPIALLRDAPSAKTLAILDTNKALQLAQQFDDLYHLFIAKIARLPFQAVVQSDEERLRALFGELLKLRRQLGEV